MNGFRVGRAGRKVGLTVNGVASGVSLGQIVACPMGKVGLTVNGVSFSGQGSSAAPEDPLGILRTGLFNIGMSLKLSSYLKFKNCVVNDFLNKRKSHLHSVADRGHSFTKDIAAHLHGHKAVTIQIQSNLSFLQLGHD